MATDCSDLTVSLLPTTKLRKLSFKQFNKVISILNRNNCWKELAAVINHPDQPKEMLFTAEDINTLEKQWTSNSSPAEAFLHYWSTYGKEQPSVIDLIKFLTKAGLLRAATEVEKEFLTDCPSEYSMCDASSDVNQELSNIDIIADALGEIDQGELTLFSYQDLLIATKGFSERSLTEGGCKIGEGAFGCVYKAEISNIYVAVKRLKDSIDKQFMTELTVLTKFRHENLLPLLGCSINGPSCCLVYQFMPNGSLLERLACKEDTPPIPWETRCLIAYGSALGINHLHTHGEKPMVHRDIKSANMLLDKNFVPKVGDFGLVRIGDSNASSTVAVTQNVYGTSIYMAREAFYGDVSVKLDSFSFGVVLLELLTGLPPFDNSREDRDLITFIENSDDIITLYDNKINWCIDTAAAIYKIAKKCLLDSKRARPAISDILDELKDCIPRTGDTK